ncbi:hypothetical protein CANINC_002920 [Pichia inconspicua]|uniref:Lethal giant larvae (Lgl)-like C-terminal domain-containing protein n=1 Tax=Pichia inconspicua TaxID=52247 RepID=A0A4V4NFL1_9ASCO|nr:hypothetical protein CANINC_002920 [[Candida] inconspicua]
MTPTTSITMFNKTPDLNLNLKGISTPWGRKTSDTGAKSNSESPSVVETAEQPLSPTSKLLSKNPLKTIKKNLKKKDDEIDSRDYFSASPNVDVGNQFSPQSKSTMPSIRAPSLSSMFKTGDNLSIGLEDMPYGIYELQQYGIAGQVRSMAFDPVQSLIAVVTNYNTVYIFGQSRVNVSIPLNSVSSIRALKFIKGAYLVAIDSANTIFVISLHQKKVIHSCVTRVPITSYVTDYSLEFVFVGLKNGSVRAFNIETGMDTILNLKEYESAVFRLDTNHEVVSLSLHPRDMGTLLISYPKLTVVYNLIANSVMQSLLYGLPKTAAGGENALYEYDPEGIYYPSVLHNLWHPNGLHCLTVYDDNSIVFWDAKTGTKILARTLFDVDVDSPTGKVQHVSKNRMTKIKEIKWLCESDPEKTSLLILGGDGYFVDGYHQLVRMNFGKMISYSLSSYRQMAKYYAQPKEQRIFAIHSESQIVDFMPLGEASPYFDGCHGAKLISVIMSDGSLKFMRYPEGDMSRHAKLFPSTLSWLNPKITCSSSAYLDKRILNTISPVRQINELPESILKGGIPCRPKYKADIGSLVITGHESGFIRLWDTSEGDLDSSHVFEIDISELMQRDDESVTVDEISFAADTLEIACSLRGGEVLLFSYSVNKNYNPEVTFNDIAAKLSSLTMENSGRALINIQDRIPPNVKKGFFPRLLIKPLDNGKTTAITTTNLGIVAIAYESGRLLVIDRRSGAVIHNEMLKDPGLSIPLRATCIEFGYGLHSQSLNSGKIMMFVGTEIGRLLTYEISGLQGSFRSKFIEKIDSNDDAIDSIIVINSENGRPAIPTTEHLKRDITTDKVYPYIIIGSKSDIRVVKNNTKIAHKSYKKNDVARIGITGAASSRTGKVAFCLVVVLGISRNILSLTLPSLTELSSLRIPYRIDAKYASGSSVLPLGDVFLRISETEAALINILNMRKPVMSIETSKSSDTLFLKNIIVPWRPGANVMLKNTPTVSYAQLYQLLTGHEHTQEKHLSSKSEDCNLAWEVSCYNPANYSYITNSKPIYYNPNAIHQNALLMETPKRSSTKSRKGKGWFEDIANMANETVENAQSNVDDYIDSINDDFDRMVSDAKSNAIKGVFGSLK